MQPFYFYQPEAAHRMAAWTADLTPSLFLVTLRQKRTPSRDILSNLKVLKSTATRKFLEKTGGKTISANRHIPCNGIS
jgi:hypothetical protein